MKTAEDRERFVELRAAGLSYAKIAEALAVSKPTLVSWAKEMQVELANARAMRADETLQKYAEARDRRFIAMAPNAGPGAGRPGRAGPGGRAARGPAETGPVLRSSHAGRRRRAAIHQRRTGPVPMAAGALAGLTVSCPFPAR